MIKITLYSDKLEPFKIPLSRSNNKSLLIMGSNSRGKFKIHTHLKISSAFQGAWSMTQGLIQTLEIKDIHLTIFLPQLHLKSRLASSLPGTFPIKWISKLQPLFNNNSSKPYNTKRDQTHLHSIE